jgi:hypothetical protein
VAGSAWAPILFGVAALLALPATAAAFGPLATIGAAGTGAGQLDSPYGVAVGPNGHAWVAEEGNHRLSEFRPDGTFVRAVGWDVVPGGGTGFEVCTNETGCKSGVAGDGSGQISYYESLSVTPAGKIIAPNEDYHRVDVFSPTGDFESAFGFDVVPGGPIGLEVCTSATGCKAGDAGDGAGQLDTPTGVAAGPAGAVWVVDHTNNRVSEYRLSGEFVRSFGYDVIPGNAGTGLEVCTPATGCKNGVAGAAAGQFDGPFDVEVAPDGSLVVTELTNKRLDRFAADLSFEHSSGYDVIPGAPTGFETCTTATGCKIGTAGGNAGQLTRPLGVSRAPGGAAFVADADQNRVNVFAADGSFAAAFGFDTVPGGPTGFELCSPATGCQDATPGTGAGQFDFPLGIDTDCHNGLWVADSMSDNVQRFGEVGTPLPPCPFSLGEVTKNKRKGTAKLPVEVPSGGTIELAGKKVKPLTREAAEGGELVLTVKAKGKKAKRALRKGIKVRVKAKVKYTPPAGEPQTRSKPIKLNRKRRG